MKGFISMRWSALVIGLVLAGGFFLAGLFTHELIFPQRGLEELKARVAELQGQVKALSEQVAKLAAQAQAPAQAQAQRPEGPERVEVSVDDDPALGRPEAPVVIVEFSDFQCPYCARFAQQTFPQLKKEYIDTGKVRLVFRDFPLSFHQNAAPTAEAAQCAHEQGRFWEYHDRLFAGQGEWSGSASASQIFAGYAEGLGLDGARFRECLASRRYKEEVQRDFNDGIGYGVTGTPTFFINGRKLVGAQPFSAFQQMIEAELKGG
ncbi:MAG: DsbA family protein [Candidatus Acetothermia bacterium]|nr:DsbA family protein [Candidatus Acetothermia bacterium]MDH7505011.1 DsbA family protein [Candidatus Acetothermia bacterium]